MTMQKARLAILSNRLRAMNPTLDMHHWSRCAAGFACGIPVLQEFGLRAERGIYPTFNGKEDAEALEEFFGLTHEQAIAIFDVHGDGPEFKTGAEVSDVIDAIIEADDAIEGARLANQVVDALVDALKADREAAR